MGVEVRSSMYFACVDVLTAAAEIRDGADLPPPATLRERMIRLLREFVGRCREAGIADAEIAEARYALVAFIDDRVLRSDWQGRAEWTQNPLQVQFFQEYAAGENFFARMRALLRRPGSASALEVYYLCVALGFEGASSGTGGPPAGRALLEPVCAALLRGSSAARIAPHAIPTERRRPYVRPFPFARAATVACAGLVLLSGLAFRVSLSGYIGRAERALHAAALAPSTATGNAMAAEAAPPLSVPATARRPRPADRARSAAF